MTDIGHNRPDYAGDLQTRLPMDYQHFLDTVAEHEAKALDLPETVESDEDDKRVSDFIAQMRTTYKSVEATRVDEKEAFLKAERAVDGFFQPALGRIKTLADRLTRRVTEYKNAKAAAERRAREEAARVEREKADKLRREQEEAERRAEEATRADRAAAHNRKADDKAFEAQKHEQKADELRTMAEAPAADLARTRSDKGTLSTLATQWVGVIDDYQAIPLEQLRQYISTKEIDRAVSAFVRAGGRQLPGVRIYEESKARIR